MMIELFCTTYGMDNESLAKLHFGGGDVALINFGAGRYVIQVDAISLLAAATAIVTEMEHARKAQGTQAQ